MEAMENAIQPYAWGSRSAIASLRGIEASERPEAELWMGAHPIAPSRVSGESLLARIQRDPQNTLGNKVFHAFGARLPFLLKVLAAEAPLSLQAHPTAEQARQGCAREDDAGIPRTAAHRNYKDEDHKPELVCALSEFDALCGFRPLDEAQAIFDTLGGEALAPLRERLRAGSMREAFAWLVALEDPSAVIAQTLEGRARLGHEFGDASRWVSLLAERYPRDVGVTTSLLLNHVRLEPGEAIYLPAGNLHAYLQGVAVEIMASSDNVLRGGLTEKHVDVPELLSVLDFRTGPVSVIRATREGAEEVWPTPAREFRLSRVTVEGAVELETRGPEILLCTSGELAQIPRGGSVFVPASQERYRVEGRGVFFRASVGTI
ncbi:MAG: mannose-6-phosphate isomerase, class I [Polyangiales bacterium]